MTLDSIRNSCNVLLLNQEITSPDVSLKCLHQGDILLSGEKYKRRKKKRPHDADNDGPMVLM